MFRILTKKPKGPKRILTISFAQGLEMKNFFKSRCSFPRVFSLCTVTQLVIKILSLKRDSPNFNLRLSGMMDGNVPKTLKCVIWQVITMDNNNNNNDDDNDNNTRRIACEPDEPTNSLNRVPSKKLIFPQQSRNSSYLIKF